MFGRVSVRLIDEYDLIVAKIFSKPQKDKRDVVGMFPRFDRGRVADRIATSTGPLRRVPGLAERAAANWYVLTGEESLPGHPADGPRA